MFHAEPKEQQDNITDWCLDQFQARYGSHITKDDIWEYLYGVMHAPDWRERYRHDLQRNLPRVPLAADFEAFRSAGRELMDLHVGYEDCPEMPLECLVDGEPSGGDHEDDAYRIRGGMRWGRSPGSRRDDDKTVLRINERCSLVGIPAECHAYTVSGRSPLEWAVAVLRIKTDKDSGIVSDPNGWADWSDQPFGLIEHLRRLAHLGQRSAQIIAGLPDSLPAEAIAA